MTKKFATKAIANELKGSAWFRQPEKDAPLPDGETVGSIEPAKKAADTHTGPEKADGESAPVKEKQVDPPTDLKEAGQMLVSKQANIQTSKQASLQTSMQAYMQTTISEKATYAFTFRYPPELLDKLEDVLHGIKKQHRRKLTKNVVAVAALAFILSDFETYGEESMLYQLLIQENK